MDISIIYVGSTIDVVRCIVFLMQSFLGANSLQKTMQGSQLFDCCEVNYKESFNWFLTYHVFLNRRLGFCLFYIFLVQFLFEGGCYLLEVSISSSSDDTV